MVGVQEVSFIQSLSSLREVRCLDGLVKAHTLLAVMTDRTSPQHQINLLRAYTFVLQIWQVWVMHIQQVLQSLLQHLTTILLNPLI